MLLSVKDWRIEVACVVDLAALATDQVNRDGVTQRWMRTFEKVRISKKRYLQFVNPKLDDIITCINVIATRQHGQQQVKLFPKGAVAIAIDVQCRGQTFAVSKLLETFLVLIQIHCCNLKQLPSQSVKCKLRQFQTISR